MCIHRVSVCFGFCEEAVDVFKVCVVLLNNFANSVVCNGVEDYGLVEDFISGRFCVEC